MKVGIFYHPDFAREGIDILRERIVPGFEGLKHLIGSGQAAVYTPVITEDAIRLLRSIHTPSLILDVKREGEYENAILSASGVVEAAECLQTGELDLAFCFVGAAGHHASRDRCWGFCFFNDVAMAVMRLRELGMKRIMIVDVDPHFGDGTRDLLGDDPDVIHVNFHSGFIDNENPQWNNYDYGIVGADDSVFMSRVSQVLERPWSFDLLILIFGHDSHRLDYGAFNLSEDSYSFLGRKIRSLAVGKPVLMVLSGGANPEVARRAIPDLITSFIESR
ncbi:MAG TPA: hypothetical protein VN426_12375 [Syntrophomonadaceae bacterium]|nr:hypothetical protein [Syntrophomonadaceae bacterium]